VVDHLPPGTDPASVDLLAGGTLLQVWQGHVAADARRPVLWQAEHGWVTRGMLDSASGVVAERLFRAGLKPGDRVLMSAEPSVDLVAAYWGALRLGLVVVPANTAYRQREIEHLVADAEPAAAIVDDDTRASWVTAAGGGQVKVVGPDVALQVTMVDGLGQAARRAVLDQAAPDDPALLVYTSGTTGAPKGAVLTHGNLLATAETVRIAWRWTDRDRLVLALPLFHLHGLGVGLHGTLAAGASAVLLPRFDVDAVLDAAAAHDATLFFGVPTMYARLAGSPRVGELRGLRLCVSGSAPLAPAVFDAIEAGSGQRVLERYGLTETGMNVSNPYEGERRPGTVGLPLPGVEVRLDPDTSEILVRGPNVCAGYWRNEEATRASRDAEGWFHTGDIGAADPDGYLRIVGRSKELIITGGYNVYPREVEDVLLTAPGVAEVAVAGRPDPEWGEVVTAFVVSAPGAARDGAALLAHAAARLAPYKCPRAVHFVEALPRNAMGKLLRGDLVARP
jgi:malonyl-CoA/methylmalonyl-CoA synthetase